MTTTQIFVEQLIVGSIFLVAILLPLYPQIVDTAGAVQSLGTVLSISVGGLIVGIAYLLGIVFDRFADSLLSTAESHHRLRFALDKIDLRDPLWTRYWVDPFPEDKLRTEALMKGGNFQDWIDYLRVRMRLARALTVFLPALTLSTVVFLVRLEFADNCVLVSAAHGFWPCGDLQKWHGDWGSWDIGYVGVALIAGIYAGIALLQNLFKWLDPANPHRREAKRDSANQKSVGGDPTGKASGHQSGPDKSPDSGFFFGTWRPPKTREATAWDYAKVRRLAKTNDRKSKPRTVLCDIAFDPLSWGWTALVLASFAFASLVTAQPIWALVLAGVVLTALSGWTWWRTSDTYMTYLRVYEKEGSKT